VLFAWRLALGWATVLASRRDLGAGLPRHPASALQPALLGSPTQAAVRANAR
jgi:hypothetical protein